jgi:hypothetical protein
MPMKNESADPRMTEMRQGFLDDCADLWDNNQDRFMALLKNSDKQAVNLTFTATIDMSETEAMMEVDMRYGKPYKDRRTRTFGDPNQLEISDIGTRPGTGLPETNGHTNGEPLAGENADTPEAYKARHPEESGEPEPASEKPKKKRKKKQAA